MSQHQPIRPTIRIGIQPNTRVLRIERNVHECCWHVWTNSNIDFTLGTFLKLYDNGRVENVTLRPDEPEDVFIVKDETDDHT